MKKMKEQTYGWYPSVRDIYLSKNQPTPYHLECLYKFKDSGYYNPMAEPPEPAFVVKALTPSPPPRPFTAFSSSSPARQGARSGKQRPKTGLVVPKFTKLTTSIPTPQWRHKLKETEWGVVSTPDSSAGSTPLPVTAPDNEKDTPPMVEWPTQQILGKYDKPHVTFAPPSAARVFDTPIPPRDPGGTGGDSGYVFVPTGDGGMEVHSPPLICWPDSHPRTPTPQLSVSSRASLGSAEGITTRQTMQEDYRQEQLTLQEEKRQRTERQRRFEEIVRKQQQRQQELTTPPRSSLSDTGRPTSSPGKGRVQSAVQHHRQCPVPLRPAYSARPARPASDAALYAPAAARQPTKLPGKPNLKKTVVPAQPPGRGQEAWREQPGPYPQPRPTNPLPPTPSDEELNITEDRSATPDYQTIVDKYGWRAEVHGDPYNIKKTAQRLPYTVKCADPVLAPEPPNVHMESKDTFFLNTIPRRRATFNVGQDWISEGLHAQRIELQQREGLNYRYKNFSFAY